MKTDTTKPINDELARKLLAVLADTHPHISADEWTLAPVKSFNAYGPTVSCKCQKWGADFWARVKTISNVVLLTDGPLCFAVRDMPE